MVNFNPTLLRQVKQTIYALKRQYPGSIVFCSLLTSSGDYATGSRTINVAPYFIRRVVILPSSVTRQIVMSVARMSANKLLAYGGEFTTSDRVFVIDGDDLPVDVKQDDWIEYRGHRYSVMNVVRVCANTAWMVTARRHPGTKLTKHLFAHNALNLGEGVSIE